jgi:hypothetical protein
MKLWLVVHLYVFVSVCFIRRAFRISLSFLTILNKQNIFTCGTCKKKCNLCGILGMLCQSVMVFHSCEIRENAWCELVSIYVLVIIFVYCVMCT